MPKTITQRADLRKNRQRVELDGTEYRITLTWRQRTRGWYMDLYDREGDPIAVGRRLVPGWSPTSGFVDDRLPPGAFVVAGPGEYQRDDLGERLRLLYYTASELAPLVEIEDTDQPSVAVA